MTEYTPSLGRQMAQGAAWMVAMRVTIRAIGLVSMVILARLLVPEDFGLVALATMLYRLLEVIGQFSFDVVLIQNQSADRHHYDTAWTLTLIRNLVLAGLLAAGAPWAAAFFEDPRLELIFYWLALAALVEGFANIGVANFRKALEFHKDFAFMVGAKLGMFVVAVPLAFVWRDYWALVAGILSGAIAQATLGYAMQPYRPRFSLTKWREIMVFSKWLLINNMLGFAYNRSDTFIIGKIVGAQSLGLYTVAHEIVSLTTTELIAPIRRALFPGYAKISDDKSALRIYFINVYSLSLLFGVPIAAGIGLTADPLVRLALGEKWLDSIPLLQALAVYGILSVLITGGGPVCLALGKPYLSTVVIGSSVAVMVPLLIWGVGVAGAFGAVWAIVAGAATAVIVDFIVVTRLLRLRASELIAASWRTAFSAVAMACVVIGVQGIWHTDPDTPWLFAEFTTTVLVGAVTYTSVHLVLWWMAGLPDGPERHVLSTLRRTPT